MHLTVAPALHTAVQAQGPAGGISTTFDLAQLIFAVAAYK